MIAPSPKLAYNIAEFCALIGLSRSRYYLIPPDERPAELHVGRRVLISAEAAAEWLRGRTAASPPPPAA